MRCFCEAAVFCVRLYYATKFRRRDIMFGPILTEDYQTLSKRVAIL
jgi:hypothetical protein